MILLTKNHEAGFHARPLSQFVKTVNNFDAEVQVTNINREKGPVNGGSPLSLLLLAVLDGHQIEVEAVGPQEEEALKALEDLVVNNFGEE